MTAASAAAADHTISTAIAGGDGAAAVDINGATGGAAGFGGGAGGDGGNGGSGVAWSSGTAGTAGTGGGRGGNGGAVDGLGRDGGGGGGGGGTGMMLNGGQNITVTGSGSVRGGSGGHGAQIYGSSFYGGGGFGGDGIALIAASGSRIVNEEGGIIAGGHGGSAAASNSGRGGDGIFLHGDNSTIVNAGTITAGNGGYGADPGNAISVMGNDNRLELHGTGTIGGKVMFTGTGNVLALTGTDNGTIDISGYQGFSSLEKDDASTWTLVGNSSGFSGTTAVSDGTLRLQGLLGGTKTVSGNGIIDAEVANAFDGGTHHFQQNGVLNAKVANAVSGGTLTFTQSSTLNASATSAISNGKQYFLHNSKLNLTESGGATGGEQVFDDNGVVNAAAAHAMSGNQVTLRTNGSLNILAEDALSTTTDVHFVRTLAPGTGGMLRLNGYDTVVGRINSTPSAGVITNDGAADSVLSVDTSAADSDFSGKIQDGSGAGRLGLMLTAGSLTLSGGANAYTGGTTVRGGALKAGAAGAFAANTDYVVDGGLLDLGGFSLTMSSLSGTGGTVALGAADLTVAQAANTGFAGILSGSGTFAKTGTGTLTLTGDSSAFSGLTTVGTGGALIVGTAAGGALGGIVTVDASALLGGIGTIGSAGRTLTVAAGAVHAPGNSIGVQVIAGDYVNHGTLSIEATPTAADRIVVAGSVDITGASLDLVLSPAGASSWGALSGPFVIIDKQSAGAVTGTFAPVTQNLLFLDTILDYAGGDGNDVTLQLLRNNAAFGQVGVSRNQIAAGTAVDALGNGNAIWRAIALAGDPDDVRASFDALSGEIHASARTALIEDSRALRAAVNDRIRSAFEEPDMEAAGGSAFWSQAFGSWGHIDGDGNAARLGRSTAGLFLGADAPVSDDWRLGAVAGYSHSSFDARDRNATGSSDNYHLGLYGGAQWDAFALRAGAAYTLHDISTARSIAIPGIGDDLKARYDAGTAQFFGEMGHRLSAGDVALEPFASVAHVSLHSDGFAEQGGAAALSGNSTTTGTTFTMLGLRASTAFDLDGANLTATGMIGWRHAFGGEAPENAMRFAGSAPFTVAGLPVALDAAVIEMGVDLAITPNATLGASYSGQFGTDLAQQSFKANLAIRF